ncbi:DNA alkylation repair protein [Enterococcus sp. LJL120]
MEKLVFETDETQALPMAKYMKNLFPFAGVAAPKRKKLEGPFLKASKKLTNQELLILIAETYRQEEREYQYYAIDLALANLKRLTVADLKTLLPLLAEKTWWDSIDAWRKVYGDLGKANLAELELIFSWFYKHENFWYRRVGINLQLLYKGQTNLTLLTQAILADQATDEFFIQKAIGWSLRDLSKTNPQWVRNFLTEQQLSPLAVREGSKYLK